MTADSQRIAWPEAIRTLLARIASIAAEQKLDAYVVGGSVRDALLGRELHDLDITLSGDGLAFGRVLAERFGGYFVELDEVNAVARVVDAGSSWGVHHIDVARLQGSLEDDLRRRDFTIDALAVPIDGDVVVDVCGGLADRSAKLVRMNDATVFDADPLRLLRAARIAHETGFKIESSTRASIRERASTVVSVAGERQRDELARIFALDDVYEALRTLDELGLMDVLLPEVAAGRGVAQPGEFHAYEVFEHNMRAVEAMDIMLADDPPADRPWVHDAVWEAFAWCADEMRAYLAAEMSEGRSRRAILKFAALLHDVAKPQTLTIEPGGRVHFFGHTDLGAEIATKIMRRFRFSSNETRFVATLVAEHLRPVQLSAIGEAPTRRALYRFYRALGDAAPAVLLLALADAASARGPSMTSEGWVQHVRYMNRLLVRSREEEGIVSPPRLLSGRDIMFELQLAEGPAVGMLLEALLEAQAAGEIADRDEAIAFVKSEFERADARGLGT